MICRSLVALMLIAAPLRALEPLAIQDNSFLIEEAYNQEPGVIQYISTFQKNGGASVATFTNEFPMGGQTHQFSYTLSGLRTDGNSEFGAALINYRYQLVGNGTTRLAISPRTSLIVPSDDDADWGFEVNIPVSYAVSDRLVTHWNAGVTSADETVAFAGASVISAVREKFHLMLEARWTDDVERFVISPGVRWAWNLKSGWQIVPGIAVPIGEHSTSVFLYLSFER